MSAALAFTYRYLQPSAVEAAGPGVGLRLATCGARQEHPHFFDGKLREPRAVGDMLLVLSDVVRTHFFLPRPANLDPVVTSNEQMLRFEGFSGCCGAYARVDLPAEAFYSDIQGRGTTNVDFNNPMRAALSRLRDRDDARLSVGHDAVTLESAGQQVVEKKVQLPVRWIKGFCEVQAYQSKLQLALEATAAEARRFVRSLPRTGAPKLPSFVTQTGRALRLSQRESRGSVRLLGTHRVRVLEPLMTAATGLRIWADPASGTSGWEILFKTGRFFLLLSPEVYRGFSGEGQMLEALGTGDWEAALPKVRAQLVWQNQISIDDLARETDLALQQVTAALAVLGARGLAGFDVTTGRYFHRELPFDLDQVEMLQPRLKDARKLLADGGVTRDTQHADGVWDFYVRGTGVQHFVRLRPDGNRCTCPWFSKHQGERGPCKHILAAQIELEQSTGAMEETG